MDSKQIPDREFEDVELARRLEAYAEDRLSPVERAERGSYAGCIAGALSKGEYTAGLQAAGFDPVSGVATAPTFQCSSACSLDSAAPTKVTSAAAGAGLGPWRSTGLSATSLSLSTATTLRALPANEVYRVDLLWTLGSGP